MPPFEVHPRNTTTALQGRQLEDAEYNWITTERRKFSSKYKEILKSRRHLPASSIDQREAFLEVYHKAAILLLTGGSAAGKSTQVPQHVLCDELEAIRAGKMVACVQPNRLLARAMAERVAQEMDVLSGSEVGYQKYFHQNISEHRALNYLTADVLVQEYKRDPTLSKYVCIIIDELHEETLDKYVLLGLLKLIVTGSATIPPLRKDLKVIFMSSTLARTKLEEYFGDVARLDIPEPGIAGRIKYTDKDVLYDDYLDLCVALVKHIHLKETKGDILLFLGGEEEI
ncbi:P-loop containing nucleoside triphosphate hydrolase protein, partial [Microthyrium microscopicum]